LRPRVTRRDPADDTGAVAVVYGANAVAEQVGRIVRTTSRLHDSLELKEYAE